MVQEHGESGTIYIHYDTPICGELDVLCNHTSINEVLPTTSKATTPCTFPVSVLSPEQASGNVRIIYSYV